MSERLRIATSHSATEATGVLTRGLGFGRLAVTVTRTLVTQSRCDAVSCGGEPAGTSSFGGFEASKYLKLRPPAGTLSTIGRGSAEPSVRRVWLPKTAATAFSPQT